MKKKVTKTRKIFLFSFLALTFGLFFWFYLLKLPSFNSVLYYAASRVHKYKKIPEIFDHTHQAFHIKYGKNVAGISPDYPGTQLIRKVQARLEPAEKLEIKVNSRDAVKFENIFKEIREKKIPLSDRYKDIEVPAAIHYKNQYHMAIIHLKGINPDHYVGDKWSFKVKIKSDSHIDGMTKFSLQNPIVRKGLNDWMLQSYARQNGLVALRSKVVNLTYNGKNLGAYLLEEHFD